MNRDERLDQLKNHASEIIAKIAMLKPEQKVKHVYIGYDGNSMPILTIDYE